MISARVLTGLDLDGALDDVARLRIDVFRAFPYLYDGSREYERSYLEPYRNNAQAIVVGAFNGDEMVGASTGMPLSQHADEFAAAFEQAGFDASEIFYCAESVLLAACRGHGIGHAFFDLREEHARKLGYTKTVFCAVQRPDDHPLHPQEYSSLEPFWRKRGYTMLQGVTANYSWRDIGKNTETEKTMQFWIRDL